MDSVVIGGFVFLVILFIVVWAVALYYIKKSVKPALDRVALYFDDKFKEIIREWNIISRSEIKTWSADINKRLNSVGRNIDKVKAFRKEFETKLDALDGVVKRLEKA